MNHKNSESGWISYTDKKPRDAGNKPVEKDPRFSEMMHLQSFDNKRTIYDEFQLIITKKVKNIAEFL